MNNYSLIQTQYFQIGYYILTSTEFYFDSKITGFELYSTFNDTILFYVYLIIFNSLFYLFLKLSINKKIADFNQNCLPDSCGNMLSKNDSYLQFNPSLKFCARFKTQTGYNKLKLNTTIDVNKGSMIVVSLTNNRIPIEINNDTFRSDYFLLGSKIRKINTFANSRLLINALLDSSYFKNDQLVPLAFKPNSTVQISAYFNNSKNVLTRSFNTPNSRLFLF